MISPGPLLPAPDFGPLDRLQGWAMTAVIAALAAVTRFLNLGSPTDGGTPIFDEKHYAPQSFTISQLGIELTEFAHMIHEGATPQRSAFLSSFFTLVGTHGLHVTFGLVWLVTLMVQTARFGLTTANRRRLMCLSMFWHFLDVVWIGVFTFVYLLGMLR